MNAKKQTFLNFQLGKKKKIISWISLAVILVSILVLVKLANTLADYKSEKKVEKNEEPGFAVKLNIDGDFPNPKEGTLILNMRLLMDQVIYNFKKVPKYVIFTESKTIPGLVFRFNVHDSMFEGGLPLMKSSEVPFLDNNMHEVVYTFKQGEFQKIFFDKNEVASGSFDPSRIGVTGFAVSDVEEVRSMDIPAGSSVKILDKAR